MNPHLPASAQRVQDALVALGSKAHVRVFAQACRSSQEAAEVLGCELARIAKSVIFRGEASGRSILVITSGAQRVDLAKIERLAGERPAKADADFVREHTGFVIGGVAPIAHLKPGLVFLDRSLLAFPTVFPAGGVPQAMFEIDSQELVQISLAKVADVVQENHGAD